MVAYNDRRRGKRVDVPTSASTIQPLAKDARRDGKRKQHQARPNDEPDRPDDETSPGYRCKEPGCNRTVVWMGPGMSDWVHA